MKQLVLRLGEAPRYGAEDFLIASSNEAAYSMAASWPDWPDPVLVLIGDAGSGKSHLAHIWAQLSGALRLSPEEADASADLSRLYGGNVLIDDADRVEDERGLFHLFNMAQEGETSMLLTAQSEPELWGGRLPDLLSRLRRAPRIHILPPDDALLRAILVKLFLDRQIAIGADVIDYLARRLGRSLDDARRVVASLDEESLARGRSVTRPMAAEILRRFEAEREETED